MFHLGSEIFHNDPIQHFPEGFSHSVTGDQYLFLLSLWDQQV